MTAQTRTDPRNFRLTAVEILYTQPDLPHLLERFVWQDYDRAPDYPELKRFLRFWSEHAAVKVHSVRIADLRETRPIGYFPVSNIIH